MKKDSNFLIVSDLFAKIYENFNVDDQLENMYKLSEEELYLLILYVLDNHDTKDLLVVHNLEPFRDKVMEIYDIQDDKETSNTILLGLIEKTGDKYIDTDYIVKNSDQRLKDTLISISKLEKLMLEAVEDEDYELAASLRDKIKKRKNDN